MRVVAPTHRSLPLVLGALGATALLPRAAAATTYRVGPGQAHRSPCALLTNRAVVLAPGDVIEVAAGTYNEACVVRASGTAAMPITLRGAPGPRPVLDGGGMDLSGAGSVPRAVLQFSGGSHWVVEHLELRNGRNGTNNAAGVRATAMARGIVLRDLSVHDNHNGLFSDSGATLEVHACEVFANGAGDGLSHNLYLLGESVRMVGNYVHDSRGGQNFKTRMHWVELWYNVFANAGNYEIDLIQGGADTDRADSNVVMVGNVVLRNPMAANRGQTIVFGSDNPGQTGRNGSLYAFNNTFVLRHASNRLVRAINPRADARVYFSNNVVHATVDGTAVAADAATAALFAGTNNWITTGVDAPPGLSATLTGASPGFAGAMDLRPAAGSPLIDRGAAMLAYRDGDGMMHAGTPTQQFREPRGTEARPAAGALDLGAFEFPGATGADAATDATTDAATGADAGTADAAGEDAAPADDAAAGEDGGPALDATSRPDDATRGGDGAADAGGDARQGGCGCRVGSRGARQAPAPWAAGLAGLALARRRRRRGARQP